MAGSNRSRGVRPSEVREWIRAVKEVAEFADDQIDRVSHISRRLRPASYQQSQSTELDDYALFGLKPTASMTEVRHRYRQLAKVYHEDSNSSEADDDEMMKRLNEAYNRIRDTDKHIQ